jgi:ABC-type transport system involved in multi-copper enzyme maturation permease subunit
MRGICRGNFLNSTFTQALKIAMFDLGTAIRTKKAFVAIILYAGLALLVAAVVVFLQDKLLADPTASNALAQLNGLKDNLQDPMVAKLGMNAEQAKYLLGIPVVVMVFFWMTQSFLPLLITVISSDILNSEIKTGSARFTLLRSSRTSLVLGKVISHGLLFLTATILSYITFLVYVTVKMPTFDLLASAPILLKFLGSTIVFGFCYLGLVAAVSATIDSTALATLATIIILMVLSGVAQSDYFAVLSPAHYRYDLWSPNALEVLKGLAAYLGFGTAFFAFAWFRFAGRDL